MWWDFHKPVCSFQMGIVKAPPPLGGRLQRCSLITLVDLLNLPKTNHKDVTQLLLPGQRNITVTVALAQTSQARPPRPLHGVVLLTPAIWGCSSDFIRTSLGHF